MNILDLPQGIYRTVEPAIYHQRHLGLVSRSALDYMHRSAAHYKAWVDGRLVDEVTDALQFGSAFHCAALEPDRFSREYAVEPYFGDCRFKEIKARRDAWRADYGHMTLLKADDSEAIAGMVKALRAHPLAGRMIQDGEPELTLRWTDDETGLPCKARSDYYIEKRAMVADIKSALDASPEAFRREIVKRRYHRQYAHYRDGFAAVGAPAHFFIFIAVEKTPPYAIGIYTLDDAGVAIGHQQTHALMRDMRKCLDTNEWPGYSADIESLQLPPWA